MNINFCCSANIGVSMYKSLYENVVYELVLISPACLAHLKWFVRWEVSNHIPDFCGVLLPGLVQNKVVSKVGDLS